MSKSATLDYSLTGENANRAIEKGLAEADWYQCRVSRATMRDLLQRRDGPAIRDTLIWFGLLIGAAALAIYLWPSWWAILPLMVYGVIYASTADSRWHEAGHGTAFKTDWMNNVLYEIASFMVMRESTVWRWSHTRHHSDTIIVGRDPEIAVPRPPDIKATILGFFSISVYKSYFKHIVLHAMGRMTADEKTFIPESEFPKIYFKARIYLGIYAAVVVCALVTGSLLPLLLIGLPHLYGSWLMPIYGLTQHAGLAENVLDHRLNCRTVYMNRINRFFYWNMNYHVEHHMFPLVPYHALPRLHEAVKDDCPTPYPSLWAAWKEIVPALLQQVKDPAYYVKRKLPEPKETAVEESSPGWRADERPDDDGWVCVGEADQLRSEDVERFDCGRKTYAVYRNAEGKLFASDGMCTHGNTHLADGLVKGDLIECSKHNGRFNLRDGSPARPPVCRGLVTYPAEEREGAIYVQLENPGGEGARDQKTFRLKVVSNRSVATFIKELVLEPLDPMGEYSPGDYIQLDIPTYENIRFREFDIPDPYAAVWERQHLFDYTVSNDDGGRRNNYSIANNPSKDGVLRFNVRIAMPPPGQDCPPGVGSSYVFNLKEGDEVTAIGPFGDFHIKPTQKEMVYIGGGAGMAPLRAHLAELFENQHTARKVSYWYGARSRQELFYLDYFEALDRGHENFSFTAALSSPLEEDGWEGATGFIHEVVADRYLRDHPNPKAVEFYLCGPPMMIRACSKMLSELGVDPSQIAYDEF